MSHIHLCTMNRIYGKMISTNIQDHDKECEGEANFILNIHIKSHHHIHLVYDYDKSCLPPHFELSVVLEASNSLDHNLYDHDACGNEDTCICCNSILPH